MKQLVEIGASSPWPSGLGRSGSDLWRSKSARVSRRGLEAFCLHYSRGVDEGKDGQDDVLGKRSPGCAKDCEAGVNLCQIVQIGAGVALLRRCQRDGRNPQIAIPKGTCGSRTSGAIPASLG